MGLEISKTEKNWPGTRGGLNVDQSWNDSMTGFNQDTLFLNKLVFIIMLASTMNEA